MLKLKAADFFIQVILIIIITVMYAFAADNGDPLPFVVTLGLLQAISIIAHLLGGPQNWKIALRKYHHFGTLIVLIMIIVGLAIPREDKYDSGGAIIIIYSLIPAIILTVIYTIVSLIEWLKLKKELQEKRKNEQEDLFRGYSRNRY